jgi:hypothetical protein
VVDSWNAVGDEGWAGLIYLHPGAPISGGLKLWRNKNESRNLDWMTPKENWRSWTISGTYTIGCTLLWKYPA